MVYGIRLHNYEAWFWLCVIIFSARFSKFKIYGIVIMNGVTLKSSGALEFLMVWKTNLGKFCLRKFCYLRVFKLFSVVLNGGGWDFMSSVVVQFKPMRVAWVAFVVKVNNNLRIVIVCLIHFNSTKIYRGFNRKSKKGPPEVIIWWLGQLLYGIFRGFHWPT